MHNSLQTNTSQHSSNSKQQRK